MRLLVMVLFMAIIGCATFGYYKSDYPIKFSEVCEELCLIRTVAIFEKDGVQTEHERTGMAIPLKNVILSLSHVTEIDAIHPVRTPFGVMMIDLGKKVSERYYIDGVEVKLLGREDDISLFKGKTKRFFPFKLGDSDKLKVGDRVVVIGWSLAVVNNMKDGMISSLNSKGIKETYPTKNACMMISVPINPGDSGSPVLAFTGDVPEIVGVVNAAVVDKGMGFAIKINDIKKFIKKF